MLGEGARSKGEGAGTSNEGDVCISGLEGLTTMMKVGCILKSPSSYNGNPNITISDINARCHVIQVN